MRRFGWDSRFRKLLGLLADMQRMRGAAFLARSAPISGYIVSVFEGALHVWPHLLFAEWLARPAEGTPPTAQTKRRRGAGRVVRSSRFGALRLLSFSERLRFSGGHFVACSDRPSPFLLGPIGLSFEQRRPHAASLNDKPKSTRFPCRILQRSSAQSKVVVLLSSWERQ